jgi:ubiquinone/menaquinone biosynthesis C-methylase UbiE
VDTKNHGQEHMKTASLRLFVKYLIYKFFWTTNFQRRVEWPILLRWAQPRRNERILDIACGDGALSLKIAERAGTIYGIDASSTAINEAKALSHKLKIDSHFRLGDAEDLPYPSNFFDKIVCSSSLEHFEHDLQALSEMNRVLKPHGKLILTADSFTDPIGATAREKHKHVSRVINFYTQATLNERFKRAGFETARSRYLLNTATTGFFIAGTVNLSGVVYALASFLACPFVLLAEKTTRNKGFGYTIIAEGNSKKEYS